MRSALAVNSVFKLGALSRGLNVHAQLGLRSWRDNLYLILDPSISDCATVIPVCSVRRDTCLLLVCRRGGHISAALVLVIVSCLGSAYYVDGPATKFKVRMHYESRLTGR